MNLEKMHKYVMAKYDEFKYESFYRYGRYYNSEDRELSRKVVEANKLPLIVSTPTNMEGVVSHHQRISGTNVIIRITVFGHNTIVDTMHVKDGFCNLVPISNGAIESWLYGMVCRMNLEHSTHLLSTIDKDTTYEQ